MRHRRSVCCRCGGLTLSAYLFDQRRRESVTEWADAVQDLAGGQVLWLDLLDISDAEELEVKDALGLEDLDICGEGHEISALTQREDYLEVTAVCVAEVCTLALARSRQITNSPADSVGDIVVVTR
jgi:hypothetical protein